jgi:hypothetical protein
MLGSNLHTGACAAADRDLGLGEHEAMKKKELALAVELALANWGIF